MCGVFGILQSNPRQSNDNVEQILYDLMAFSQTRGQDSSGIATWTNSGIHIIKRQMPAEKLSSTTEFKGFLKENVSTNKSNDFFMLLGNCRLSTDGDSDLYENSQPFVDEGVVLVHNGLIVNKADVYKSNPQLKQSYDIDTEILADLFAFHFNNSKNPHLALRNTFEGLRGTSSCAIFIPGEPALAMATNNGSLYFRTKKSLENTTIVFASEAYALDKLGFDSTWSESIQVLPNTGIVIGKETGWKLEPTSFDEKKKGTEPTQKRWRLQNIKINENTNGLKSRKRQPTRHLSPSLLKFDQEYFESIERCVKCILPKTFPFIEFDSSGVCNHCRNYKPQILKGEEVLRKEFWDGKKTNPKILLALSGGRDSCYALDYLVTELGLDVTAYTYDWGAVTPLARRNMSILCGELGVEHILIAADLNMKRKNIKMNVEAWLKRPKLGSVPLFMAGDKQFFHYAQKVKKQINADHLVFGMNPLERTDFKIGFCGIRNTQQDRHYNLNYLKQLKMITWYANEFIHNPSYLNSSLIDTSFGFWAYYLSNHNYNILYQYIPWSEKTVNETLIRKYGWEVAPDTSTTWRIGDGTASFYNYIYASLAGFTESDTFRSNQIREGQITRSEAMNIMLEENRPRLESIKWYCDTMNLDFNKTISTINRAAIQKRERNG